MPPLKKFFGTTQVSFNNGETGSFSFSYDSLPTDVETFNHIPDQVDHGTAYKLALDNFLQEINKNAINPDTGKPLAEDVYAEADIATTIHSISGGGVSSSNCSQCACNLNTAFPCGCTSSGDGNCTLGGTSPCDYCG